MGTDEAADDDVLVSAPLLLAEILERRRASAIDRIWPKEVRVRDTDASAEYGGGGSDLESFILGRVRDVELECYASQRMRRIEFGWTWIESTACNQYI